MDLELDDIFQWQTPFCTLLADIDIPVDSIDGMLDIELPEIVQEDDSLTNPAAVNCAAILPNSTSASDKRISSPLWPCDLPNILLPTTLVAGNTFLTSSDPVGSPQSSTGQLTGAHSLTGSLEEAPFTPPAAKPKRARATRATEKKNPKRKKKPDSTGTEQLKESRLPTQAEHIIRERQRRDDMAAKYLILESLLPVALKRERAVVVEDAMLFVKDLQRKRSELLKRRAQLKLTAPHQCGNGQGTLLQRHSQGKKPPALNHDSSVVVMASCMKQSAENCTSDSPLSSSQEPGAYIPTTSAGEDPSSGVNLLQIHVHVSNEEVMIEIVCGQPRPNFQSFLLQAVESFGLDVTRCIIHRVAHGFVQCMITCSKSLVPSLTPEIQSSASLIGALRSVIMRS